MNENPEKKEALVILGAGVMQIPAIISGLNKNLQVIVFDGNKAAPGKSLSRYFIQIDIKKKEKILEKCIEYQKKFVIKGIFTAGTDFSYIVAWLAEKLSLPGISYETALKATDKSMMRQAFKENNVPSPDHVIKKSIDPDDPEIHALGFPLVIKPVDSMGARGTVRVNNKNQLEAAFNNAAHYSRSRKVIIEQFVDGKEYSLDALVSDSRVFICGIADRHIFFPPYFIEMGHTMPSDSPAEVLSEVGDVFKQGIKAIGIDNGAAKGDIKYSGSRAVAGEIAARLSGGYMSGWTFPYSTGFSVIDAAVDISMGIKPEKIDYKYINTSAERAFISIPGIVETVCLPDYILQKDEKSCIKDFFITVSPGDRVDFPKNNVEKSGNIIAVNPERAAAVFHAEKACRDIIVKLVPGNELTGNFLFREKENWIPDAFKIDDKYNIDAFGKMPDFSGKLTGMEIEKIKDEGFRIVLLPDLQAEKSLDWQGRSLYEAFLQIAEHTDIREADLLCSSRSFAPAGAFWISVLKGSVQGGIWFLETLKEKLLRGDTNILLPW